MLVRLKINDYNIDVTTHTTIIQACLKFNLDIPRFCFHEKLNIAGNCRMCLVEVVKSPKPIASCSMQIISGMIVKTNTILIKKARESVLEFLLVNHPLDCPICDQGGECDLQDQVMIFGGDIGRFYELKRSVENKFCGPFVKTVMTRCIHCTRCIRFLNDIAGVSNIGLLGRGNNIEIGTYLNKFINTEVIGNIIDLCPVGALTSKPYAFQARSWELISIETVDVIDSIAADIRVDILGTTIARILPRVNELINSYWLSDVSRFSFDGLCVQRLLFPYFNYNNSLLVSNWNNVIIFLKKYYYIIKFILKKPFDFSFISGEFTDAKSLIIIKDFANVFGNSNFQTYTSSKTYISYDFKNNYIIPVHKDLLSKFNYCFLIGLNVRLDSPLYNIVLRKLYLSKKIIIVMFSNSVNMSFYIQHLALNINILLKYIEGKNLFCNLYIKSLIFILGDSVMRRSDSFNIISFIKFYMYKNWTEIKVSLGVLQTKIGKITGAELGFSPGINYYNNNNFVNLLTLNKNLIRGKLLYQFLLSNDIIPKYFDNNLNIFIGFQGNALLRYVDLILPATSFLEKQAFYINIENILRSTLNIFTLIKEMKDEARIFIAFFYNIIVCNNLVKSEFCINYYLFKNIFSIYNFNYIIKNKINIINNNFIKVLLLLFNISYIFILITSYFLNFKNKLIIMFFINYINKFKYNIISLELCLFNLLNYNSLVLNRLCEVSQIFNLLNSINLIYDSFIQYSLFVFNKYFILNNIPFISFIDNFYKNIFFCVYSINMSLASNSFKLSFSNYL